MDQNLITLTILGMAAVTWPPRFLPALFLANRQLNQPVQNWLSHVPTAIMAALVAPSILAPAGSMELTTGNLFLWVSLPTFACAMVTKNFFATVAVGIVAMAGARFLGLG